jgi:hypothetical protein
MTVESIKRVSIAALNMWMWIITIECYVWIQKGLKKENDKDLSDPQSNINED